MQKLSELHKYRVGSSAMPNPDKIAARGKLQSKVAEAALARVKASNQQPPSTGSNSNGPAGTGTGRVGGNIFGFTNTASSRESTGSGFGTAGSGSSSSSSRKKVVKKPPPNFGGGVLGKK